MTLSLALLLPAFAVVSSTVVRHRRVSWEREAESPLPTGYERRWKPNRGKIETWEDKTCCPRMGEGFPQGNPQGKRHAKLDLAQWSGDDLADCIVENEWRSAKAMQVMTPWNKRVALIDELVNAGLGDVATLKMLSTEKLLCKCPNMSFCHDGRPDDSPSARAFDTLFYLRMVTLPNLMTLSAAGLRKKVGGALLYSRNESLDSYNTGELAGAMLTQNVLRAKYSDPEKQLNELTLREQREAVLALNREKLSNEYSLSFLDKLSTYENARLAYKWYLNSSLHQFMSAFENIKAAKRTFSAHSEWTADEVAGQGLHGLQVVPRQGSYYGVYHALVKNNTGTAFNLYLAKSADLKEWTTVSMIEGHASMGKLYEVLGGVLLLYEKGDEARGVSVAAHFYDSWDNFTRSAPPAMSFVSSQTISKIAEGSPNLLAVEGDDPRSCRLSISFYYNSGTGPMDQYGLAVLTNFDTWQTAPALIPNEWLAKEGFNGRVGDQASFIVDGKRWFVLVAQENPNDWSSWRILVGDGLGFIRANLRTPLHSKSFAHAFVTTDGDSFITTAFLPNEPCNSDREVGELIYSFKLSAADPKGSSAPDWESDDGTARVNKDLYR